MASLQRIRAGAACGLASAVLAALVPIVGGAAEPGYSHAAQYISELGASGATNAAMVSMAGFVPVGCLVLALLVFSSPAFPRTGAGTAGLIAFGAVGVAYLVTAIFPCDEGCPATGSVSQSVHNLFGAIEYVGALLGLTLLARAFGRSGAWQRVSTVSAVALIGVAVGFFGMLMPDLAPFRGFSQRIAEASIFLWVGYVSLFLFRHHK